MAPLRLYLPTLRTKNESGINCLLEIAFLKEMHDKLLLPALHLNLSAQSKEGHFFFKSSRKLNQFLHGCGLLGRIKVKPL